MRETWRSWLAALAGAWFVLSAWIFQANGIGYWGFILLGGLLILSGADTALREPSRMTWRPWLGALFGALLAVSPWLAGFASRSTEMWPTLGIAVVFGVALNLWIALAPGGMSETQDAPRSRPSSDSRRTA